MSEYSTFAIYRAAGKRVRGMPITPEKIMRAEPADFPVGENI
jgi:hypothetical protein